jgi:hypothetical protein
MTKIRTGAVSLLTGFALLTPTVCAVAATPTPQPCRYNPITCPGTPPKTQPAPQAH